MKTKEIVKLESIWNFLKAIFGIIFAPEHSCNRCSADLKHQPHQEHCVYSDADFESATVLTGNKSFEFHSSLNFRLTIF